jgi:hypothetical protein
MKSKHCNWCDSQFETKLSYQIYCSAECRDAATKEKIAEKYNKNKIEKRRGKPRYCKLCKNLLSIYNDSTTCLSCDENPDEVTQALKEIKGIVNGKIKFD